MNRPRNKNLVSPADREEAWRRKLTPRFAEAAHVWKDLWTVGGRKDGLVQREFLPGHAEFLEKERRKVKRAGRAMPDTVFMHLCWTKWRKLPQELFHAIVERYDLEAYDQLAQVSRSFYKWSHGKLDYFEDLRAKGDERHVYLMFAGLLEGGIHTLTETELADFFDAICPCNKPHSEDALKKLRDRTRRKLVNSAREASRKIRPAKPEQKKVIRWRKQTCLICAKPYHRKVDRIA